MALFGADLLAQARRKQLASEAPLTFMGRRGELAREVDLALDRTAAAPLANLEAWLEASLGLLEGREPPREDDREALTCVFLIVREAVRRRVPIADLKPDLAALGFREDFVARFCARLHGERTQLAKTQRETQRQDSPRLERLDWRLDLVLASSRAGKEQRPSLLFRLQLNDGRVKQFRLSSAAFQALRYRVAKLLQRMAQLERHPMMRIMATLEAEHDRKLLQAP